MAVPAEITPTKRAYRRREVCELYGVSLHMVDRLIRDRKIQTRRIGERVLSQSG